jgi:hypothetical protein
MAYQRGFFVAKEQNLLLTKVDPKSKKKILSLRISSKSLNSNYSKRIFEKATQVSCIIIDKVKIPAKKPISFCRFSKNISYKTLNVLMTVSYVNLCQTEVD